MSRLAGIAIVLAMAAGLAACGGEPEEEVPEMPEAPAPEPMTPPAGADPAGGAGGGALPAGVTQAMVTEGQQLFGTTCVACHGQAGVGTDLGPALNDDQWINLTTGEMDELVSGIRAGVPEPQQFPNPMPPMGGGNFTDAQLQSLAAYIYSISRAGG